MSQRVVTGKCRLSYVNLLTTHTTLAGKEKYDCVILVPKTDTETKSRLDAAVRACIEEGKMKKWNGKIPPMLTNPVHDGDGQKPRGGEYGPECKGHWVISASNNPDRRPGVYDINLNPIIDPNEIYSGVYARVALEIYPFAAPGNNGISCSIGNVQKIADGDHFGGGVRSASDDFGGSNAYDEFAL